MSESRTEQLLAELCELQRKQIQLITEIKEENAKAVATSNARLSESIETSKKMTSWNSWGNIAFIAFMLLLLLAMLAPAGSIYRLFS